MFEERIRSPLCVQERIRVGGRWKFMRERLVLIRYQMLNMVILWQSLIDPALIKFTRVIRTTEAARRSAKESRIKLNANVPRDSNWRKTEHPVRKVSCKSNLCCALFLTQNQMRNSTIFLLSVHPCDKPSKGGCQHKCNKNATKFFCSCQPGYELDKNGRTCGKGRSILFQQQFLVYVHTWNGTASYICSSI